MDELDERLGAALRGREPGGGALTPDAAVLDRARRRGRRRRRAKLAGVATLSTGLVVAGITALALRNPDADDTVSFDTTPTSAHDIVPVTSAPSVERTVPTSERVSVPGTSPSTSSAPTTTSPSATAPGSTVFATTLPATTMVVATVPATTVPPSTLAATTTVQPIGDDPTTALPMAVVNASAPSTSLQLGPVLLRVEGGLSDPSTAASLLTRSFDDSGEHLSVWSRGARSVTITTVCEAPVCPAGHQAWLVGSSLWVQVDDLQRMVLVEVDLRSGTATERLAGRAGVSHLVSVGNSMRFVMSAFDSDDTWVAEFGAGTLRALLRRAGPAGAGAAIALDRSGERALFAANSTPVAVSPDYEVVDLASGDTLVTGSTTAVGLVYLQSADFTGNRIIFGDSFVGDSVLVDVQSGDVVHASKGPGCFLDDGTAVFESRAPDNLSAGPLDLVRPDGTVVRTSVVGTGHNGGATRCAGDRVMIADSSGRTTIVTPDGVGVDAGIDLAGHDLLQFTGHSVSP